MSTADETAPLLATPDAGAARAERIEEAEEREAERPYDGAFYTLAVVGLSTFVLTTWVIILTNKPSQLSWFAFHPPLQSLAILLFGLGILTLQPTSNSDPSEKKQGLTRHQIFNFVLGFPVIIAGVTFMFVNKASHGAKHFTTWHSIFGLISFIWIVAQVAIGAGSAWFGGAAFGGGERAKSVYKYHRLSGYLLLVSLLFTAYLAGSWSDWFILNSNLPERIIGYGIAPLAVLIAVFSRMRTSKMQF